MFHQTIYILSCWGPQTNGSSLTSTGENKCTRHYLETKEAQIAAQTIVTCIFLHKPVWLRSKSWFQHKACLAKSSQCPYCALPTSGVITKSNITCKSQHIAKAGSLHSPSTPGHGIGKKIVWQKRIRTVSRASTPTFERFLWPPPPPRAWSVVRRHTRPWPTYKEPKCPPWECRGWRPPPKGSVTGRGQSYLIKPRPFAT